MDEITGFDGIALGIYGIHKQINLTARGGESGDDIWGENMKEGREKRRKCKRIGKIRAKLNLKRKISEKGAKMKVKS